MQIPAWFQQALAVKADVSDTVVGGARIQFRTWGDPAVPAILLVHGNGAHSHWWDFIAPALLPDYFVAAMDTSGAGDSDHRDQYSAELFAEEINQVATALPADQVYLVGHSFGGTMSRIASWLHPETFAALILVDSALAGRKGRRRPPPAPRSKDHYYPDLSSAMRRFRLRPPQPCDNQYILDHIAAHSVRETDQGWQFKLDQALFAKMRQDVDYPDAITMIQEIQAQLPVAMIYGDRSRFFPKEYQDQLQKLFGNRLYAVTDAYHHLFLDQPLAFMQSLKTCLADMP